MDSFFKLFKLIGKKKALFSMLQKKIKVLELITSLNIGGTEHYLLSLIQRLDKKKYEVKVGYLKERGPLAEAIEKEGISPGNYSFF